MRPRDLWPRSRPTRVLPQSDLEESSGDALFDDRAAVLAGAPTAARDMTDHEAIIAPVDELAHADPCDGARVRNFYTAFMRRSPAISVRLSCSWTRPWLRSRPGCKVCRSKRARVPRPTSTSARTWVLRAGLVEASPGLQRTPAQPSQDPAGEGPPHVRRQPLLVIGTDITTLHVAPQPIIGTKGHSTFR